MAIAFSAQRRRRCACLLAVLATAAPAWAAEGGKSFEIYGFAQADFVQDLKRVNPNWDDTLRPSRIRQLVARMRPVSKYFRPERST